MYTVYDVMCYLINSFDLIAHALHTSIVQYAWEEATTVTFQEGNKKTKISIIMGIEHTNERLITGH